jgi:hypothetical protein
MQHSVFSAWANHFLESKSAAFTSPLGRALEVRGKKKKISDSFLFSF